MVNRTRRNIKPCRARNLSKSVLETASPIRTLLGRKGNSEIRKTDVGRRKFCGKFEEFEHLFIHCEITSSFWLFNGMAKNLFYQPSKFKRF